MRKLADDFVGESCHQLWPNAGAKQVVQKHVGELESVLVTSALAPTTVKSAATSN